MLEDKLNFKMKVPHRRNTILLLKLLPRENTNTIYKRYKYEIHWVDELFSICVKHFGMFYLFPDG